MAVCRADHIDSSPPLRSIPTRRSSDLALGMFPEGTRQEREPGEVKPGAAMVAIQEGDHRGAGLDLTGLPLLRSEEHTSELQSHLNLVCRLLLEKNNTTSTPPTKTLSSS